MKNTKRWQGLQVRCYCCIRVPGSKSHVGWLSYDAVMRITHSGTVWVQTRKAGQLREVLLRCNRCFLPTMDLKSELLDGREREWMTNRTEVMVLPSHFLITIKQILQETFLLLQRYICICTYFWPKGFMLSSCCPTPTTCPGFWPLGCQRKMSQGLP